MTFLFRSVLTSLLLVLPAMAEDDAFPLVTNRVQGWVNHGYYQGCSVWIAKGNETLYQKSFGGHSEDSEVFIASAGKWLASAALLAVVDEGKLSLDDTVEKWLPEFKNDPKGKATLRQLFSHTSGFPPYQPDDRPHDGYQTCAESVAHLLPLAPHFKPGEQFDYGGLAMQTVGRMAEIATGKDWETIFQEKIARPLGMTKTRFTPVDPGHTPMLAGAAVSTLHDYSRFLTLIDGNGVFEGRRIISEKSMKEMIADQVGTARVKREEFVERVRGNTHKGIYGLGMWREELDDKGDATLMSSPSWAGTYPWIDRKTGIRGLIIAHVDTASENVKRDKFSGFWTSPVLANMVRAQLSGAWTKPTLPHHAEGVAIVNGAGLAWEAAGLGEPLILLHGHSFDRRMWDPQFAELAAKYRVIRYDLRGYGLSDMPVEGRDFSHPADLCGLMDALGIPKAHVVGLSLGAFVTLDMLALHPDRMLSATIASGGIYTGAGSGKALSEAQQQARLAEIETLRATGIESHKASWREALLKSTGARAGMIRPLLTDMIADWSAWQPLHVEPPHLLGGAVIDRLAATRCEVPVLILAGENDTHSVGAAKPLSAVLPNSRLHVLKEAGHLSNLEQPSAFFKAVEDFLSIHPANPKS
jgi:serine-type D-Ala-D-Ala carboxypeptidase